jgi:hypothetical protein
LRTQQIRVVCVKFFRMGAAQLTPALQASQLPQDKFNNRFPEVVEDNTDPLRELRSVLNARPEGSVDVNTSRRFGPPVNGGVTLREPSLGRSQNVHSCMPVLAFPRYDNRHCSIVLLPVVYSCTSDGRSYLPLFTSNFIISSTLEERFSFMLSAGCHEKHFVPTAGRRGDVFLDSPFQRTLGTPGLPNSCH